MALISAPWTAERAYEHLSCDFSSVDASGLRALAQALLASIDSGSLPMDFRLTPSFIEGLASGSSKLPQDMGEDWTLANSELCAVVYGPLVQLLLTKDKATVEDYMSAYVWDLEEDDPFGLSSDMAAASVAEQTYETEAAGVSAEDALANQSPIPDSEAIVNEDDEDDEWLPCDSDDAGFQLPPDSRKHDQITLNEKIEHLMRRLTYDNVSSDACWGKGVSLQSILPPGLFKSSLLITAGHFRNHGLEESVAALAFVARDRILHKFEDCREVLEVISSLFRMGESPSDWEMKGFFGVLASICNENLKKLGGASLLSTATNLKSMDIYGGLVDTIDRHLERVVDELGAVEKDLKSSDDPASAQRAAEVKTSDLCNMLWLYVRAYSAPSQRLIKSGVVARLSSLGISMMSMKFAARLREVLMFACAAHNEILKFASLVPGFVDNVRSVYFATNFPAEWVGWTFLLQSSEGLEALGSVCSELHIESSTPAQHHALSLLDYCTWLAASNRVDPSVLRPHINALFLRARKVSEGRRAEARDEEDGDDREEEPKGLSSWDAWYVSFAKRAKAFLAGGSKSD